MMDAARNEMAATAMARANIYGLLAAVFRAEPTLALVREIKSPAFSSMLSDLGFPQGGGFHDRPSDDLAADLALEYTRLFIGPGPRISPHESLHVDMGSASENLLYGRRTVAVKRFIEATGLQYHDSFSGLPDHISAEFELMGKLAEREGDSWSRGDAADASWCRETQRSFLEEHILAWVPRFCKKAIAMAEQPFYREMAELTDAYLGFEKAEFADCPGESAALSGPRENMGSSVS